MQPFDYQHALDVLSAVAIVYPNIIAAIMQAKEAMKA